MRWLRGDDVPTATPGLDAVRIFTPELELRGSIAPTGQRVTDMLLRGQDLAFLPAGADPSPEAWVSVAPADILFVVPPPLLRPSSPPEQYRRVGMTVEVGPWSISGDVHLREGERLDPSLARRQPFLPVTGATIRRPGDADERVDVAIVNLGRSGSPRVAEERPG